MEEGEDLQELAERARERHARRANKLLSTADNSGRGTPSSDAEGARARKSKKGKGKMTPPDLEQSQNTKRKRGMKSPSLGHAIHQW